jgi:hypothetical protein
LHSGLLVSLSATFTSGFMPGFPRSRRAFINPLDALIVRYYEGDKLTFASKGAQRVSAELAA